MLVAIQVHYLIALIVFASLIVGLFTQFGRRVALWALLAQLLAGSWLIVLGDRPSPWHPALWLAAVLLTQTAVLAGKHGRPAWQVVALILLALASSGCAYFFGLLAQT
jgi:hypothetical protein